MASYDYSCKACGEFEVKQSMLEDAYDKCPKCGGVEIKRLIGDAGSGIHFRGQGFYKTDYKKMDGAFDKYQPRKDEKKHY